MQLILIFEYTKWLRLLLACFFPHFFFHEMRHFVSQKCWYLCSSPNGILWKININIISSVCPRIVGAVSFRCRVTIVNEVEGKKPGINWNRLYIFFNVFIFHFLQQLLLCNLLQDIYFRQYKIETSYYNLFGYVSAVIILTLWSLYICQYLFYFN